MTDKEFVKLMLEKSKDKTKTESKSPFSNLKIEEVENLTKEIMENRRVKK